MPCAQALGAIGRGNPDVVDALICRLSHEAARVRIGAADALRCMETDVCRREQDVVNALRPLLDRENEGFGAVLTLASVGRHLPEARKHVIDLARSRPPKWKADEYCPDYRHDVTMFERGAAIDAMRYLTDYPEECVPALTDALDNFEELDPDECYDGPQARIAWILGRFGAKAGEAAVPLAHHLNDEPDEWPRAILRALAAMGPAARDAMPLLEAFRERHADEDEPLAALDAEAIDEISDLPGWAIQQIRGMHEG